MVIKIDVQEGYLLIKFDYCKNIIYQIKQIHGSRWDPNLKCWRVPHCESKFKELLKIFYKKDICVHADLQREFNILNAQVEEEIRYPWMQKVINNMTREMKLKGYGTKTIKSYTSNVRSFLIYSDKMPEDILNEDVKDYLLYLIDGKNVSHSYVNQCFSAVRFFFMYILGKGNVVFNIPRPKKESKLPVVLSQGEIVRLINAVENFKYKTIFTVIYSAGLRISEVVNLQVKDLDVDRMLIHVRQSKGRKDRYTLLSNNALNMIRQYMLKCKPEKWLFAGEKEGAHITERSVQRMFEKAIYKARIKKDCTVHSLRHSFATHLLENGTDLRYIQEILGHKNTKTTEIYTHVTEKDMVRIRSPLDNFDRRL